MLHILIITDDIDKWSNRIRENVNITNDRVRRNVRTLWNGLISFVLRTNVNERERGQRYSAVIMDKAIPKEIEWQTVQPMIRELIYTEEYRRQMNRCRILEENNNGNN